MTQTICGQPVHNMASWLCARAASPPELDGADADDDCDATTSLPRPVSGLFLKIFLNVQNSSRATQLCAGWRYYSDCSLCLWSGIYKAMATSLEITG